MLIVYSITTTASPNTTTLYTLTIPCTICNVPCLSDVADTMTVFVDPESPPQTFPFHVPTIFRTNQNFRVDSLSDESNLKIFDLRGRIIYSSSSYQNNFTLSQLSSAAYLYEFILPDYRVVQGKFCVVDWKARAFSKMSLSPAGHYPLLPLIFVTL